MRPFMIVLALALGGGVTMASESISRAGDVRAVLDRQVAAWNRGDLEEFMRGYWKSDALTFFSGATRTAGYDATLERYRKKYQRDGQPMGHLDFPSIDVMPLGRTAALVRGEWRLRRGRETLGGL